jgi:hypothetical protein
MTDDFGWWATSAAGSDVLVLCCPRCPDQGRAP